MTADFETYRKRAERMKKLEVVLERAKDMFNAAVVGGSTDKVWLAMAKLKEAVSDVDKLPPPPLNTG
jgi:hypothetical protein